MKKLASFIIVAGAVYFGSAFYMRGEMIALAEQGCAAGKAANLNPQPCLCLVGIMREEIPVFTFWTDIFSSDLGVGNVDRAEMRARQECRGG